MTRNYSNVVSVWKTLLVIDTVFSES